MTCQDTEPSDEYVKGTCYTDGRESQPSNIGCSDRRKHSGTHEQQSGQNAKKEEYSVCCQDCRQPQCECYKTFQQIATKHLHRSTRYQQTVTTTLIDISSNDLNLEQRDSSESFLDNTAARKEWGETAQGRTKQAQDKIQKEMKHKIQTFFTTMSEETEAEWQPLHKLFQVLETNNNLNESAEPLCKTCRDGEFVDEHGDCIRHKNCEESEIAKGRNYCKIYGKQGDLCPGCCNEINMQFDKILEQNRIPGDPHLEELGNAFETLYTDHFNKKTETKCKCAYSYHHHTTIEVKSEDLY